MALLSPYRTLRLVPVTSDTICPLHSSHLCHFLSDEEAQWVVTEAETFTVSGGGDWLTDRHAQYATTDFAVEDCPTLRNWWNPRIEETVLPTLAKLYDVARSDLELDDLFIVKYEASEAADAGLGGERGGGGAAAAGGGGERPSRATQDRLANHHDDTLLSFSVLLSDPHRDFEGGGTSFAASDWMKEEQGGEVDFRSVVEEVDAFDESRLIDVVKPAGRGDLFCHCGRLLHGGAAVTRGKRTLLVGFVHVGGGRANREAYMDYLCSMGRLRHAKRLAASPKLRGHMAFSRFADSPVQAAEQAQLEVRVIADSYSYSYYYYYY